MNMKTFCPLAWTQVFVEPDGRFYHCCMKAIGTPAIEVGQQEVKIENLDRFSRVQNSPYMKTLRKQMLNGERPAGCEPCFQLEDGGIRSKRQSHLERPESEIAEMISMTQNDGSTDFPLSHFDIRAGNICNLQCRMCSPHSSQLLNREWQALLGEAPRVYDWANDQAFQDLLVSHASDIEVLQLAGGEPLVIPGVEALLEQLVESGHAGKIRLRFNTNLTKLPDRMIRLWEKFNGVNLFISIDGFGEINDFIRHPSRWDQIAENIKRLESGEIPIRLSTVNTTVQAYNVMFLDELIDFVAGLKTINPVPRLSFLSSPEVFSAQVLPGRLRREATERLEVVKRRHSKSVELGHEIDQVIQCISVGSSSERYHELKELTERVNRFRQVKMPAKMECLFADVADQTVL